MEKYILLLAIFIIPTPVKAQEPICLTEEQRQELISMTKELDDIHKSKATLEIKQPVIIVRDWNNRVYVNGGSLKPIELKLKIGDHIDRDLEATLPVRIFYREKPEDPVFRLRIRAQAGALIPNFKNFGQNNLDAGLGFDWIHLGLINMSINTHIRSSGIGIGADITKNFGGLISANLIYDGFQFSPFVGVYFAF